MAPIALDDLKEIEPQKEKIQRNTLQFVQGQPANNVLLTGARGTGKSSLIKACLNEYAPQGLRLIEVDKADLVDLPDIVEVVRGRPEKFIVFCDDLSFEEGEPGYKALKSILDGSVAAATPNVLIYATSNRRHLLPEYMKENLTLHAHRGRRGASGRGGRGEDLAVRALRPVGELLSVQPGRVPGHHGAVAVALRRAAQAHRGGAAGGAGVGAGARLAQRPRGLPVRPRLRGAAPRHDAGAAGGRRRPPARGRAGPQGSRGRGRRAAPRRRRLPADVAPAGQGLRRLLGIPGRQGRARRDGRSRRCGASCRRRSASPSAPCIPGASSASTIRMRWCG